MQLGVDMLRLVAVLFASYGYERSYKFGEIGRWQP